LSFADHNIPIVDQRLPEVANRPSLIVTVDTEEEGLWSGEFKAHGNTVENTRGIERFQSFCEGFGIRPTYLIDTPIVEDERTTEMLAGYQAAGTCEVGAHLHPWCTPPFAEVPTNRNSYMCNLPSQLQRRKLLHLTEAIGDRFGRRPTSFRAGRCGLDHEGAGMLRELEYVVDSSVKPFVDISDDEGPCFENAPYQPYRVGEDSLVESDSNGKLLEVPLAMGFSKPYFERASAVHHFIIRSRLSRLRLLGVLDRFDVVRRISFSPEKSNAASMIQLVERFVAKSASCLVMWLHSSSLLPGCSPYAPDEPSLERLYQRMAAVFEHCITEHAMQTATLTSFAESFQPRRAEDAVSR